MIYIDVKIIPNSAKNMIVGFEGTLLKIKIHAPPEKNQANKELIRFLSKKLSIAKSNIAIVKGKSARNKRLAIECPEENFLKCISEK